MPLLVLERIEIGQQLDIVKTRFANHVNLPIHLGAHKRFQHAVQTVELALLLLLGLRLVTNLHTKVHGLVETGHIGETCPQLHPFSHRHGHIKTDTGATRGERNVEMIEEMLVIL